ncbi:hypothetical protein ACFLSP_01905 [Bacteroidota bacterium]
MDGLKRRADGSWKIYADCVNFHPGLIDEVDPADLLENQKQSSLY